MNPDALKSLLQDLRDGKLSVDSAAERLRELPFERLGNMARVDHHRQLRVGSPEIVYGEGKTPEQIAVIMNSLNRDGVGAFASRVDAEKAAQVTAQVEGSRYYEAARCVVVWPATKVDRGAGVVGVISAGTSDIFVAEEASLCLEFMGHSIHRITDVGVSGLHRLLDVLPEIQSCEALIVIAGMEGALPTVLAGLVDRPIVAVPTSVGYGVGLAGLSALSSMLSSCAPGLSVVNIDNGLGAAICAARINQRSERRGEG